MINLIASYYENIWPFKEKFCSLFFDEWKYLIKAPIWSWKSFLFFDSPRYALYKDSSRNMLNLQSKNGEISLIFEVDWTYYLIKRILKSTRIWNDSCSSQLYTISYSWDNLLKDIKSLTWNDELLQWWVNFLAKFEEKKWSRWSLEEIQFKNETDLQATLEWLLPPKEVFLSTVFLLQDADNIFEMRPADRLIVLKNVFNLLGIDDAKDKVQEKKKEVQYKLKSLQDHTLQDQKLRSNLISLWSDIKSLEENPELNNLLCANNWFFEDIEWFFDQISLVNFSLNWLDKDLFNKAEKLIQDKLDNVVKLDIQIREASSQLDVLWKQNLQLTNDINKSKSFVIELQNKINSIDIKKWNELKDNKLKLYQKWNALVESATYSDFHDFISFWNKSLEFNDNLQHLDLPKNLKEAYDIVQIAKDVWALIKSQIEFNKSKLENFGLQSSRWIENREREIEKIKELKSRKEDEIKLHEIRIKELDEMWKENSDFDCPDICKKCPHINAINKQQYEQYSQQKEKLNQTLKALRQNFIDDNYDGKLETIMEEKNPYWNEEVMIIKTQIEDQLKFQDSLKRYLLDIWFSKWENKYHERELIQNEIQNIDQQLLKREDDSKNLEKYQEEKISTESSIKHFEQSLEEIGNQINIINSKIDSLKWERENANINSLQNHQKQIKQVMQYISLIEVLIDDNAINQNLTKQLQEDEKKLTRLYSILWKEIVLYALDWYLPVLSDIINWYLSQCVDYTIRMQIIENNEKLELEAKILDSKWEREVKSLSWWQRTILKLVWMLAISSYLRTPLLFLDETINNLDIDTVGKVSEMINNFVKQRTMKFYTVTHNKEIQDMQIWDDVIELNVVEKSG